MSKQPTTIQEAFVWFTRLDDPHRIVVHDLLAKRIKELEAEVSEWEDLAANWEPDLDDATVLIKKLEADSVRLDKLLGLKCFKYGLVADDRKRLDDLLSYFDEQKYQELLEE